MDCSPLRKSLEITYLSILPKGCFPFIYISLEIAPDRVDPNVHPNKKEVHFLDQDEIVERICDKLNIFLAGSNSSRSYSVQVSHTGLWSRRVTARLILVSCIINRRSYQWPLLVTRYKIVPRRIPVNTKLPNPPKYCPKNWCVPIIVAEHCNLCYAEPLVQAEMI